MTCRPLYFLHLSGKVARWLASKNYSEPQNDWMQSPPDTLMLQSDDRKDAGRSAREGDGAAQASLWGFPQRVQRRAPRCGPGWGPGGTPDRSWSIKYDKRRLEIPDDTPLPPAGVT